MNDPDLSRLDPQARRFLAMVSVGTFGGEVSINERRRSFEALMQLAARPRVPVDSKDRLIPVCGGEIVLRTYTPTSMPASSPGLVYFHGGGLVAGSIDTHDGLCRSLAHEASCRVLAINYRLAPEHPFPVAILDALIGARWIVRHAEALGLARDALAIGGDSGGATLAAVVCQMLRPRSPFKVQVLLCPVLDAMGTHASRLAFGAGFLLDASTMAADLAHYAPRRPLGDPKLSPLRSVSVVGLPRTIIHTAGFDPLRDEGAAYAARLVAAGVPVTFTCHETLIHHFYGLTSVIPAARAGLSAIAADLRAAFA